MNNLESESEEEKEARYARNLRNWLKKAKADGLEHLENLWCETVISKTTFFDSRHPNHTFELSLLVRKRSYNDENGK
jgi:hypothetical protein